MKGKFIVLDGCDFTGKSTQIQRIATYLRNNNIKHITTREPGGTEFGEQIREIILEKGKNLHHYTELLLFLSARCEHIHNKIIPMLEQGISIICDRFLASTYVYQCILRNIPVEVVLDIHKKIMRNFQPDITFIMDMHPADIMNRMKIVARTQNSYDSKTIEEIEIIRNGFLEFAKYSNYTIINANQDEVRVFEGIQERIDQEFID